MKSSSRADCGSGINSKESATIPGRRSQRLAANIFPRRSVGKISSVFLQRRRAAGAGIPADSCHPAGFVAEKVPTPGLGRIGIFDARGFFLINT
jgi:hypothetical protein